MQVQLPKLMLGTSPFIGAGQFGRKAYDYRTMFFSNERNMERLFIKSATLGVQAVQLIVYEPLVNALKAAARELGTKFFVAATIPSGQRFEKDLELIKPLKPEIIAIHALFCDALDPRLHGWIKQIRELGASPAASTHYPGETIEELDRAGFEFEVYLAPVNSVGYAMAPTRDRTLQALETTDKQVIAIKPLAARLKCHTSSLFSFIYQYADSISVGIVSDEEMEETYTIAKKVW
ncbi:MAG: hypothetical protein EFT35_07510 [Methanophagales archaeon ANME-1-THS]|nr:MAG: hypothetical protein EFT35_07510 [Methanophagales archaeon ANME-1-THS]